MVTTIDLNDFTKLKALRIRYAQCAVCARMDLLVTPTRDSIEVRLDERKSDYSNGNSVEVNTIDAIYIWWL